MDLSWIGPIIISLAGIASPLISAYISSKHGIETERNKVFLSVAEENYKKELELFNNYCDALANLTADSTNTELKNALINNYFKLHPFIVSNSFINEEELSVSSITYLTHMLLEDREDLPKSILDSQIVGAFEQTDSARRILDMRFKDQIQQKTTKIISEKHNTDTTSWLDTIFHKLGYTKVKKDKQK